MAICNLKVKKKQNLAPRGQVESSQASQISQDLRLTRPANLGAVPCLVSNRLAREASSSPLSL
jgi:hypothetical protein